MPLVNWRPSSNIQSFTRSSRRSPEYRQSPRRKITMLGTFIARAVSSDIGKIGQNGTPALVLQMRVTQGDAQGRTFRKTCWISDAALEFTVDNLRSCGWTGSDLKAFIECSEDKIHKLLPDEVSIVLEEQRSERDGKVYTQVQYINRIGAGTATVKDKLGGNELDALSAKIRMLGGNTSATTDGPEDDFDF
jgi:hypothetical protein